MNFTEWRLFRGCPRALWAMGIAYNRGFSTFADRTMDSWDRFGSTGSSQGIRSPQTPTRSCNIHPQPRTPPGWPPNTGPEEQTYTYVREKKLHRHENIG